jgi:putative protease
MERSFFARGQVYRDVEYEIVSHSKINPIDNDIAKIYEKNGNFYIMFKSLETESGKILDSVHSGNINAIVLPSKLPKYSFFRRKIKE